MKMDCNGENLLDGSNFYGVALFLSGYFVILPLENIFM